MELTKKRRRKLQSTLDQEYGYRQYQDRDVYVEDRGGKVGRGVFAVRQFLPGELVFEITGQLISVNQYEGSPYAMCLDDVWMLEPTIPGAFINHSCSPNCDLIQLTETTNGLVARCNIEAGTELSFDYQWDAAHWIPKCKCRAKNCRGWVVAEGEVKRMKRMVTGDKKAR